jgi:hypothetical protein
MREREREREREIVRMYKIACMYRRVREVDWEIM